MVIRKYIIEPWEQERDKIMKSQESLPKESTYYQLIDLKVAIINFFIAFCESFEIKKKEA